MPERLRFGRPMEVKINRAELKDHGVIFHYGFLLFYLSLCKKCSKDMCSFFGYMTLVALKSCLVLTTKIIRKTVYGIFNVKPKEISEG